MLELKSIRKLLGKEKTQDRPPFFSFLARHGVSEEELSRHFEAGNQRPFTLEPFYLGTLGRQAWFEGLKEQYKVDVFDLEGADISPQVASIVNRELSVAHRLTCVAATEKGLPGPVDGDPGGQWVPRAHQPARKGQAVRFPFQPGKEVGHRG